MKRRMCSKNTGEMGTAGTTLGSHSGSALVGLVVIIVLVLLVYGVQRYLKATTPDPDIAKDLPPWKEWRLREQSQKPAAELGEQQPKMDKQLVYSMNAEMPETLDPRGEVTLNILPDGTVWGTWLGSYYNDKKENFDIQSGGFEGSVFPGKTYEDENGQDPAKLYFLAKGSFLLHRADFKSGSYKIVAGDIYARGWISKDLSVLGDVTITSDDRYSETFVWRAARPDSSKQTQQLDVPVSSGEDL
jgi:hypothetical protein